MKFNFTGTSLKGEFSGDVKAAVRVDGMETVYNSLNGVCTLAAGLEDVLHTAEIQIRNANGSTALNALYVDETAEVTAYTPDVMHIQFIGDSITTDTRSYSYTIPETYGFDYSIISMSGIALQDGAGWYYATQNTNYPWYGLLSREMQVGMESAYFSVKSPKDAYSADGGVLTYNNTEAVWQTDRPDVIVIGLGTNDNYYINNNAAGIGQEDFKNSYIGFVNRLSTEFTNADIYILRPFNNTTGDFEKLREATYEAYTALSADNQKIKYIDTTNWEVEISSDNTHPTAAGYAALRDLVYKAISESLN